ncbi:hypothetical protein HAZT_HAZT009225 [Hyalella azteca]|uniref:Uncharacterized protein n=1 Tax=Hyalella azteca TaxID=294128 RepID=A0A6A0GTL3_HYAAZ|nr:hypothetical protein HAZT_HAZT009225 [Hyalella azteca]
MLLLLRSGNPAKRREHSLYDSFVDLEKECCGHEQYLIVRLVVVSVIYGVMGGGKDVSGCWGELKEHLIGYFVLLSSCIIVEAFIAYVAMRGTILDPEPRASMQYLLYVRLGAEETF